MMDFIIHNYLMAVFLINEDISHIFKLPSLKLIDHESQINTKWLFFIE